MNRNHAWVGTLAVSILTSAACGAPGNSVPEDGPVTQEVASAITLRVSVSDETDQIPVEGQRTEIWLMGEGSWFPNLESGGDFRDYESLAVGTTQQLYFYPLGRNEPEILIDVPVTSDLCPNGCARDTVLLSVWDDRFEVLVPGAAETKTIPR